MKSFTKKCRGCLWPRSNPQGRVEEERTQTEQKASLVRSVLGWA